MKSHNRTWLKAAAATVGAGALAFGGAVLPAVADESPEAEISKLVAAEAPEGAKSKAVVDADATKFDLAEGITGADAAALEAEEQDGHVKVTSTGQVLHIDEAPHAAPTTDGPSAGSGAATPPNGPATGSRPGAPVTVYLDFDGETLSGTQWNDYYNDGGDIDLPAAAAAGPATEAGEFAYDVWAGVAEDYAPFNINVTTTRPSDDKLFKSSADDNEYGVHVIISDVDTTTTPISDAANTSGLSWLDAVGSEYLQGSLVFTQGIGGGDASAATARSTADTASHESGHAFALEHDGIEGASTGEYYYPRGGVWGPIMGATYDVGLSQWSNGDYAGATNQQDDLATITDRSAAGSRLVKLETPDGEYYEGSYCTDGDNPSDPQPGDNFVAVDETTGECLPDQPLVPTFSNTDRADYAEDDAGDTIDNAAELDNAKTAFSTEGVIGTTDDVDVYSLTTIGGPLSATVEALGASANLDTKLVLRDSDGEVLAEDAPASTAPSPGVVEGLNASVSVDDVEPGTYYLAVSGVGEGDGSGATPENAGGYSDYGSLGNYTLSGEAAPFVVEDLVITSPEDGTEVTGGDAFDVTGTGEPGAVVALSVGGDVVANADVAEDGSWAASVDANQYGQTEVTAAQTFDGIKAGTATVTVVAPVDAPVITSPEIDSTTEDTTPTISGTGIAGAEVELSIVLPDGDAISATVTVDADGNWEYTPESAWEAGTYGVAAAQTINGTMSDVSNAIQFAIEVEDSTDDSGTDGTTDGTDGNTDGDDSTDDSSTDDDNSTDDSSTDGDDTTTDGDDTDEDTSTDGTGTDGDDNGTDEDTTTGTDLAVTGAELETAPIVMLALGLLVVGAGTAAFAIRQRKLSAKE